MVDLNGLKAINDRLGHAAGDALLRRVGEVLNKAVDKPRTAARIGGDEFAVLLPATDERQAATLIETIRNLVELNNQFYSAAPLNLSLGAATSRPGERLEDVAKRADAEMYEAKREYYSSCGAAAAVADEAALALPIPTRSTPSKAWRPSGSILKPVTFARVAMNTTECAIGTHGASSWKMTCACAVELLALARGRRCASPR